MSTDSAVDANNMSTDSAMSTAANYVRCYIYDWIFFMTDFLFIIVYHSYHSIVDCFFMLFFNLNVNLKIQIIFYIFFIEYLMMFLTLFPVCCRESVMESFLSQKTLRA